MFGSECFVKCENLPVGDYIVYCDRNSNLSAKATMRVYANVPVEMGVVTENAKFPFLETVAIDTLVKKRGG